ncbi:MAG: hypothetical protein HOV83_35770 [Catenulispora sp.]|nr:hypothetical protein [Catenulispora sp.]
MTEWLRIDCLDVGQGTGVLAALYSADPETHAPDHLILMDLGSEQAKREAGVPTVEYVKRVLNRMAQPTLDAVFLSHSDSDHVNLISDLMLQFTPYEKGKHEGRGTLRIRWAMYGGDWSKYKKGSDDNVLEVLTSFMLSNASRDNWVPVQPSYVTSYRQKGVGPSRQVGFVDLRLLVGNAANTESGLPDDETLLVKDAYSINTMSLVIVLEAFGTQFVMTGDATGATMRFAAERISIAHDHGHLKNVFAVTAPHHGSLKTALALGKAGKGEDATRVVARFIRRLAADSVEVSAGIRKGFNHPSAELLRMFAERLQPEAPPIWIGEEGYKNRHFYTAYFTKQQATAKTSKKDKTLEWPSTAGWRTVQSNVSLFTSVYYSRDHLKDAKKLWPPSPAERVELREVSDDHPAPPFGVMWQYQVKRTSTGTFFDMERYTNRSVQALFAAWDEQERLRASGADEAVVAEAVSAFSVVPDSRPAPPERSSDALVGPVRRPAAASAGLSRLRVLP